MKDKYLNFIRAVSVNRLSRSGVAVTTSSFIIFIMLEIPRLLGILTNAYLGLITYLTLPLIFVIGLLLIPAGIYVYKKETGTGFRDLIRNKLPADETEKRFSGSRIFNFIAVLTFVNVIFLGLASMRMLSFMDSPVFCGTACHSVMSPEWITYQSSPHARVKCVDCHVGEGVDALVDSKLNGAWQVISLTFNLYKRPIPTPVHQLRPARETCEKCHWPDKFYGARLKSFQRFGLDKNSTPAWTTLNLKIDSGEKTGEAGIHWHVSKEYSVEYSSVDDEREEIMGIRVIQGDKVLKTFKNNSLPVSSDGLSSMRTMDCVDCHNRATHIYEVPEHAIDEKMSRGEINRKLPFIKREGLYAISRGYSDKETANQLIDNYLNRFYFNNYPDIAKNNSEDIAVAVTAFQKIYNRNIHPEMNIEWGSYPDHSGHENGGGCFRCHNRDMKDKEGKSPSYDCNSCHSILAYDSENIMQFLMPPDKSSKDSLIHEYLRAEFLNEK